MDGIEFETLNNLCDALLEQGSNNVTNLTTINPEATSTTSSLVLVTSIGNGSDQYNGTTAEPVRIWDLEFTTASEVEEVLQQIEATTEQLVIPIIAYVGIAVNILVCCLIKSDSDMRASSRMLIYSFLICQMLYLASVAIYLEFKQLSFATDITVMNYISLAMSITLTLATWILFLLISESYRTIKFFKKAKTRVLSLGNNLAKLAMLVLLILIFHIPYVPHIRVILYHLDKNFFSPCSNSLDDIWQFILPKKEDPIDHYYIVYFCLMYCIVTYALPYFLIGCQDKDVIDLLHWVKDDLSLSPDVCAPAHTAFLSTVLCNTYLVFSIPKVVSMIFYVFNQPLRYLDDKYRYFYFMNAFANLTLVLWPINNLHVFLRYNSKIREYVKNSCIQCFYKITWPVRKRLYVHKKKQSMQCVCKSDEEIEIASLADTEQS